MIRRPALTHVTHFSFVARVLTQTDKVIPGLDASAFMFAWIRSASVNTRYVLGVEYRISLCMNLLSQGGVYPGLPVSDATRAQQQLCIAPPLSLQNNVDIELLGVYEDMLHAAVEVVQLGLTLPYCVVGFGTT